jgi:hypothetical protein
LTVDYYYASNYDSLAQSQKTLQNTTEANGGFKSGTLFVYHSACFNKGTKILCLNEQLQEEWLPIETLKENQLVKTYLHGYKKIKMIGEGRGVNTSGRNIKNMYKYNYKSNDFDEPLMITGAHAILVDDIKECKEENDKILLKWHDKITMVDDKYLLLAVVSSDFEVMEEGYEFTYYHFCLESENEKDRYGVWANGVLTESISLYDFKTCF